MNEQRPAAAIILTKKVQANWRLPEDLRQAVNKKAEELKRNPSELVEAILREALPRVTAAAS